MGLIPVRHSIPASHALAAIATEAWHLAGPVACTLWRRRLADVFLLRARSDTFVLKLFRAGWRPKEELEAELRFARHLFDAGVSVAEPYSGKVVAIEAPEGTRYAVLHRHVPGCNLYRAPTEDHARSFGRLAAQLHAAAEDYADARRPYWDVRSLLREPIHDLEPYLRAADLAFLQQAADELEQRMAGLPEGFCHGDIDPGNVHFDNEGNATLFDFDFCGRGPLAYDVAVFAYEAHWAGWGQGIRTAFLEGYGDLDPYFIERLAPVRGIWFLGLLACNANDWGHHEVHEIFLPRHIKLLRKLMDETA